MVTDNTVLRLQSLKLNKSQYALPVYIIIKIRFSYPMVFVTGSSSIHTAASINVR
jgi:hypothetical protein